MRNIILAVVGIAVIAGAGTWLYVSNKENGAIDSNQSSSQLENDTEDNKQTEQKQDDLDIKSAAQKLRDAGLNVENEDQNYFQIIDAEDGYNYDVDGTAVEIYEFKDDKSLNTAKGQLEDDGVTVFSTGTLLVLVHSTDNNAVNPIRNVLS